MIKRKKMDEGKNSFPISQIVIFKIFCILSSIIMLLSFSCSKSSFEFSEEDKEIAKSVSIKTWVEQIGEGDLVFHLKLTNNSEKTLEVEDNIMIGAHMMSNWGDKKMQTVLIVQSKENTSHEERQLMFSTGAPSLIGINNNTIIRIIYGCSGQGIEVINGNKCGNWISSIKPHGSLIIQSKLYTNYEIKTGWVACPGLYFEKGVVFRILIQFGDGGQKKIILPLLPKNLVDFINDNSISLLLRRWAVVWLSALSKKNSWQQAETILKNKNINLSIRKGAAGGLAIFSDPKAMKSVNEVMWDKETHEDLRLYCYWALTWSSHKEAKNYINSALDHFDNNISSDAKNRMKK